MPGSGESNMTIVYVLAALLVLAAAFFALRMLPNRVRVIPHRPEPGSGMYTWKVDFRLWFRPRRNGYIVQHVRIRERVARCHDDKFANPTSDESSEFWEAWPVQAGTRIPWDRLGPVAAPRDFDDAFVIRIPFDKLDMYERGRVWLQVRGVVHFFEDVTLPPSFIANNPATKAGQALSDVAPPPFWRPGGTQHDLDCRWNNCGDKEVWDDDEVPKFTE